MYALLGFNSPSIYRTTKDFKYGRDSSEFLSKYVSASTLLYYDYPQSYHLLPSLGRGQKKCTDLWG